MWCSKNFFKAVNAAVAGMKLKSTCKKMKVRSAKKRFSSATKDEIKSIESKAQCRNPTDPTYRSNSTFVSYSSTGTDKKTKKIHNALSNSAATWYIGSIESRAQFCGEIYDHALQVTSGGECQSLIRTHLPEASNHQH